MSQGRDECRNETPTVDRFSRPFSAGRFADLLPRTAAVAIQHDSRRDERLDDQCEIQCVDAKRRHFHTPRCRSTHSSRSRTEESRARPRNRCGRRPSILVQRWDGESSGRRSDRYRDTCSSSTDWRRRLASSDIIDSSHSKPVSVSNSTDSTDGSSPSRSSTSS